MISDDVPVKKTLPTVSTTLSNMSDISWLKLKQSFLGWLYYCY